MRDLEIVQGSNVYRLSVFGFNVESISVPSGEQENNFERQEGLSGRYLTSSVMPSTTIEVVVEFKTDNDLIYALKRDELKAITTSFEPFYIRELRSYEHAIMPELPGETSGAISEPEAAYANGLQYLVLRSGVISYDDTPDGFSATVTFETAKLPYAESIGTSLQLHAAGLTDSSLIWSYGMNLVDDPATRVYKFTSNSFNFYYPGDVPIRDYNQYREITITLKQSATSLSIYDDNWDVLRIDKQLYSGDVIKIQAFKVLVNGVDITAYTNKYFFNIVYGWNAFYISGATSLDVAIDLRFYYGASDLSRVIAPSASEMPPANTGGTADTTPPSAPVVNEVNVGSLSVSGTSEEGATITLTFSNGAKSIGTAGIDGSYDIPIAAGTTLTPGQTVSVTAKDRAGNVSSATTSTIRAYAYTAPTGPSTVKLQQGTTTSEYIIINNMAQAIDKGIMWREFKVGVSDPSWYKVYKVAGSSWGLYSYNLAVGTKLEFYFCDLNTEARLSPSLFITVVASEVNTNLWRSSTKDLTATLNKSEGTQVTEVFKIIGNTAQNVNAKTSGDTLTMTGAAGDIRYYLLTGLKANTKYTLSYVVNWTDTTQGLHTHAWGLGYLMDSEKGKRKSFTFTTTAAGQYGFGQGASDTPPASYYLNVMHNAVSNNTVTYSNITLNEGSADLGYSAGAATGV